jgi:tetratricopeptide (TPR) repeat protein
MAPEQFLRMPADARSDQFAFCIALYEALYGSRPFAGKTIDEIGQNVVFGQLIAPPRTAVPQWLERVVLRGLSSQADDRFPSMPALLAELDRDRRRGRRLLAVGAGALALGMAGALVLTTGGGEVCEGAAERLAGAWDPTRSAAVERALLATGVPFAGDTWARTRVGLEAYAQQWQEMHRDACLDHRRGEQSSVALDLRMVCLQRRRTELAALVTMLTEADAQTVTIATQAVSGLVPIATRGDLAALLDEQRRLAAPTDPSRAAEVEALRGTLAQVEALMLAGQYQRGLTVAEQAVGAAQRSGDAAVLAEALLLRGILHMDSGAPEAAESDLWRANLEAIRSGHEQVQARALVKELYVLGHELHEFPAAERAASSATALIARIAADRSIAGELRNNVAVLRSDQGRLDEAIALHRENLEFRRRILPEGHMDIAMTLSNLAVDLQERGRLAEAEPLLRDATVALRTTLGPVHPWTLVARLNLALIRHEAGDTAEAQAILDEALPLLIVAFGADHPLAVEPRAVAAELQLRRGEVEPALRELEQVLPLARASAGLAIRLRVRFTLAQALWDHAPEQRARALELARAAEQDAVALGTEGSLAAVRAWLAEHH